MNEAERLRKALEHAAKSGMALSYVLEIIEKVYKGKFRNWVFRTSV